MTASSWRAPLLTAICLGGVAPISNSPLGAGLRTVLILALTVVAVGVSLAQTMGLRRASRGIRAVILVPIAFCVVATAVLMLESRFHAGLVLR